MYSFALKPVRCEPGFTADLVSMRAPGLPGTTIGAGAFCAGFTSAMDAGEPLLRLGRQLRLLAAERSKGEAARDDERQAGPAEQPGKPRWKRAADRQSLVATGSGSADPAF